MNRRVMITGASRGLGAALADSFANRGARVFAGTRSVRSALDRIIERHRDRVVAIDLDVTSDPSVSAAVSAVAAEAQAIDILINNAAIRSPSVSNPIETIDFKDVARTFEVNSIGALRVTRAFLPLLRLGSAPILVNVSSEAGSIGACRRDREFDYCMSKAAMNMATALLGNYLRGTVRVLSLHPGWLRTDMGGANAALDPATTAEAIVELIARESESKTGPAFIDYEGRALPW
jgi:NAD(P)-dependent dehydrogenase (short-subunit alcohol dehydrogenase family)